MKICVIDDEEFNLNQVNMFFERYLTDFIEDKTTVEYIEVNQQNYKDVNELFNKKKLLEFDIIITDYNMPNFLGEDVIRKLIENKFKGKIICYSKNAHFDVVKNLENISKNIKVIDKSPRELVDLVEKYSNSNH